MPDYLSMDSYTGDPNKLNLSMPSGLNLPTAGSAGGLPIGDSGGGGFLSNLGGDGIFGDLFGSEGMFNADMLSGMGSIAGGIGGIMGMMNAGDQLDLAEDQFGFQKDFANRNISNQAQLINNKIQNDKRKALIASYRTGDPRIADAERQAEVSTKDKTVDASPI